MYIFKSDPSDGSDDSLLKSSKASLSTSASSEALLARLQAPVVPAQIATLSTPLPAGIILANLVDSTALAGVISTIGQPANQPLMNAASNKAAEVAQANSQEKLGQDMLSLLANTVSNPLPILSLAEVAVGQAHVALPPELAKPIEAPLATVNADLLVTDLSILPPGEPVMITKLSEGKTAVTVIAQAEGNVRIADFKYTEAVSETFINTGLGTLTVTTPATNVSSLSLSGNVEFVATGIEVTSGITVSGGLNSSNVTLFITGGASSSQGSSDVINLGNGDNFVFNAGDGAIYVNLGSGANSVVLAGVGASGEVSFATDDAGTGDFIAIAANGASSIEQLASIPLITITGLNSGDAISFLSDLGSTLNWAGGSALSAQVQLTNGDDANLATWLSAAQTQASQAHSVAWFYYDGATYILETASGSFGLSGSAASLTGDTLVKLTGTVSLTDAQLSQGIIQLAG
ncbi:hypothetical protein ICN30_08285 [Polynucleobacter sp. 31A-FELB]|uniref:hypothetical protein n=1 Tax=Polynucleobacter sp. 31A-FELB TaxID=2689096 RepID=UPI001C0AF101|nr:hypothetical protein [Polynucleobacter sp. 31A-FELB]MBU3587830.1 hypothetical protein [Polynucleobacter sp. 31A-FELB]